MNRTGTWRRAGLAGAVPVVVMALSSPALAQAPVRLVYEAPPECPAQPAFVAAVEARGGDFDRAGSGRPHRVLVVAITRDDRGFAGAFQARDDGTASDRREVHGQSCAEVADALAVVAAIALRSDAAPEAAPVDPIGPPPAPPPAAKPAPSPERFVGHTGFFPPRTEEVLVSAGTVRFDRKQTYALVAGVMANLVPDVLVPRYDLSLTTAHFVTMPDGSQRLDGTVVKVHVSALGPATHRSPDTTTSLVGISFGIGLCGSPHFDTRGLVILICGEYGGGFMNLETRGTDGSQIQSKNAGFGTLVVDGEIQYNLGARFFIQANVGGGGVLGDITAERLDGTRIFGGSSAWGHGVAYGQVGFGLRF